MNLNSREWILHIENSFSNIDEPTGACLSLWARVLHVGVADAAQDIKRGLPCNWLMDTRNFPGSFEWLCDLFDIDANHVRSRVEAECSRLSKQSIAGYAGFKKETTHES